MKRLFVIIILLGAVCVTCGCAQLGQVYYKKSQEFSFHPPANWRYNPPEEEITIFQSHHIKGYDFRPNLNVVMEDTELMADEDYMDRQKDALKKLPGYEELAQDSVGNFDAWRLTYNFFNPHFKETPLTAVCQLMLRDTRIYVATYIAPEKLWRKYENMFCDSLDTFKFGEEAIPPGYKDTYTKPELATPEKLK